MVINSAMKLFSGHYHSILNVGIVLMTFIESYIFPFAIVKWMIVITKYGGLIKFLWADKIEAKPLHPRYKYKLQLMTVCRNDAVDVNQISHVNMIVDCDGMQLSYCGQDCRRIPPALQKMYGPKVRYLDFSYNSIETLRGLEDFPRLEELILDNNKLNDAIGFPNMPRLRTLSLNNNQITELESLVDKISECCPALTYLSLLSNKACPNELSHVDKDDSDYQRYRYFVIYKLPTLQFLDSRRVSSKERLEAATRGQFMRVRRPPKHVTDAGPVVATSRGPAQRPLPVDFSALGKHKGAYGKCLYKYSGKHSEGNRFIVNNVSSITAVDIFSGLGPGGDKSVELSSAASSLILRPRPNSPEAIHTTCNAGRESLRVNNK